MLEHVIKELKKLDWREEVTVNGWRAEDLEALGMKRSMGIHKGQLADYRLPLADGTGLHAHVYKGHVKFHLDEVSPSVSLLEHLRQDAPGHYVMTTTAIGGALAHYFSGAKDAWKWGAFVGLLFGAFGAEQAANDDQARRQRRFYA